MRNALLVPLLAAALACGSSGSGTPANGTDGGACPTASTGTLSITIGGLPDGVDGSLTITGPDGTPQRVTVSKASGGKLITGAKSGGYTFALDDIALADPIVRKVYHGAITTEKPGAGNSGDTATLCDGETMTVDLEYGLVPTSNKIWWGSTNSTNDTLAWSSSQLGATGAPDPAVAASTKGALPGAFDKDGNLWVIDGEAGNVGLERYAWNTLSAGPQTPDVVLSSDAFIGGTPGPASMAFDAKGNLWVGILYSQSVVEIDATQLTATGTVTPKVQIVNVDGPNALAFDAKGNLWVGSGDAVIEYVTDRLGASTSAAPDARIAAQTPQPVVGPLTNVLGLAFTGDGKLWVDYGGTIARIDNLASGTVTPDIQIKTDVLSLPSGIALDEGGGLWMAYSAGKICKLGATQLAASGTVTPEVVITSSAIGSATSPALFPAPASSPLYSALK